MGSRINVSKVTLLQIFSDLIAIFFSLFLVFKLNGLDLNQEFYTFVLIEIVLFQFVASISDFYRSWRGINISEELIFAFKNLSVTVVFLYLFSLPVFGFAESALLFVEFSFALLFFIGLFRVAIRLLLKLLGKDRNERVLVIGNTAKAQKLFASLASSQWSGCNPVNLFSFAAFFTQSNQREQDAIVAYITAQDIQKVYLVVDAKSIDDAAYLVKCLADSTCTVVTSVDLFNSHLSTSKYEDINGMVSVSVYDTPVDGINIFLKRLEDIVFSSLILLMISPLLCAIAIAIKLNSKGPVLFKQTRYGLNGKPIRVYKFRSMSVMENGEKVTQATKNDPRVTTVGRFIRRTSLDELPQFFNVLQGTMSIVGPRPHAVAHNEEYRKLIYGYMLRHKVKPGITGLAQINGWRGETDTLEKMEKRIECDLEYIRTWSLLLDIRIIFLTVFKGFINKSAY